MFDQILTSVVQVLTDVNKTAIMLEVLMHAAVMGDIV